MEQNKQHITAPLYDPRFEHDACGIGAVVDIQRVTVWAFCCRYRMAFFKKPCRALAFLWVMHGITG